MGPYLTSRTVTPPNYQTLSMAGNKEYPWSRRAEGFGCIYHLPSVMGSNLFQPATEQYRLLPSWFSIYICLMCSNHELPAKSPGDPPGLFFDFFRTCHRLFGWAASNLSDDQVSWVDDQPIFRCSWSRFGYFEPGFRRFVPTTGCYQPKSGQFR